MARAYSPREIARLNIEELPFEGEWETAFGRPGKYDTWFICGPSASGKSSFVMGLSKYLSSFGKLLYVSLEEGVGLSFKKRIERFRMQDVNGKFQVVCETMEDLTKRLSEKRSARFIVIDSFQYTGMNFQQAKELIDRFPRKTFIFVSQEDKGRPMGKAAIRLKFEAGVKIRTKGFRAYCEGRFVGDAASYYTIWEEGAAAIWNNL
jgi:hypothetical protein